MRRLLPLFLAIVFLAACEREDRDQSTAKPPSSDDSGIVQTKLSPGPDQRVRAGSGKAEKFEVNAYDLNNGKRLFNWFNCTGCHGHGGGGSGPALIDDTWIYGSSIENIAATIREGRPNGMPSFRGRLTDEQVWQLAGYVRSLGGAVAKDSAPGRDDDMHGPPAENRRRAAPKAEQAPRP